MSGVDKMTQTTTTIDEIISTNVCTCRNNTQPNVSSSENNQPNVFDSENNQPNVSDSENNQLSTSTQIHHQPNFSIKMNSQPKDSPSANLQLNKAKRSSTSVSASCLIVVSNRLPFVVEKNTDGTLTRKSSAGGLVTAVAPVVVQSKGVWIGWPGPNVLEGQPIPEANANDNSPTSGLLSSQVIPVHLTTSQYQLYYNGCCNATFWPLFHSMPDKAVFDESYWVAYRQVNERFAQSTLAALRQLNQDGSVPLVWIHDYHLMLAATTIRQVAEEEDIPCKIGYFLHIPFPPWDMIKIFPWYDDILQGILGCDLVGFHIEDYCINFIDCCQRGLGGRVDRTAMLVEHGGRTVRVRPLPISIPFKRFDEMANLAPDSKWTDLQVILGVDRLDYTKGLIARFQAFERLLIEHPELLEKVMLFQIAVPSRTDVKEYQDLKSTMDKMVGQINGRFSTAVWSPIRYIYGCLGQAELAGFYRDADVALVTPLRDGMNLVAKEFVACRTREPGVLILSPFAGAAGMMLECLLVNPYENGHVASVLYRALTMPKEEREVRMNALRNRERIHDVDYWMKSFLKSIGTLIEEDGEDILPTQMQPITLTDFDSYLGKYVGQKAILALLLDYDGTLSPLAPHPDLATIPPETKKVLERLANMPDVFVAVISGRGVQNVKDMVGIEGITYAGNHGLEIIHPDGTKFTHPMPTALEGKVGILLQQLQEECCKDGAWVENKGVLLTFHFRNVPLDKREGIVARASELISEAGFKIGSAHCALESKPDVNWNKGRAAIYILRTAFGVDWSDRIRIIYAGDDVTDEDAISALKGMAYTFRVANSNLTHTAADKRLPSTDSVLTLLHWVENHMARRKPRANNSRSSSPSLNLNGQMATSSVCHIPHPV